jgi:hypothetical protein
MAHASILLDICQPATLQSDKAGYYAHWGLTHFLLDAITRSRPRLRRASPSSCWQSCLSTTALAQRTEIQRLRELRNGPNQRRRRHD